MGIHNSTAVQATTKYRIVFKSIYKLKKWKEEVWPCSYL